MLMSPAFHRSVRVVATWYRQDDFHGSRPAPAGSEAEAGTRQHRAHELARPDSDAVCSVQPDSPDLRRKRVGSRLESVEDIEAAIYVRAIQKITIAGAWPALMSDWAPLFSHLPNASVVEMHGQGTFRCRFPLLTTFRSRPHRVLSKPDVSRRGVALDLVQHQVPAARNGWPRTPQTPQPEFQRPRKRLFPGGSC